MTIYETFLRSEATRRGIDPEIAAQVANSEGGLTEPARVGKFSTGWSWYAFQLHFGGAGYLNFGTVAGMGNRFAALTGWAPGDPLAWKDAMRYALDAVKQGGWGPWYGAQAHGITGFRGVDTNFHWSGTPDAEWDYKNRGAPVADVTAILNQVITLGKAETGKPYSGPIVGQPDSFRWGTPGYDCSSFVSTMYAHATNGAIKLTGFTDAAFGQCDWAQTPQSGDVVFYHYVDPSQPGVRFPHMGIWLSPTDVLDCRYSDTPGQGGVGVRPHLLPVGPDAQGRYRQTCQPKGLADVAVPPTGPTADPRDALIAQLRVDLDDARSKLGVATVNYAQDLENVVVALRKLKPS